MASPVPCSQRAESAEPERGQFMRTDMEPEGCSNNQTRNPPEERQIPHRLVYSVRQQFGFRFGAEPLVSCPQRAGSVQTGRERSMRTGLEPQRCSNSQTENQTGIPLRKDKYRTVRCILFGRNPGFSPLHAIRIPVLSRPDPYSMDECGSCGRFGITETPPMAGPKKRAEYPSGTAASRSDRTILSG